MSGFTGRLATMVYVLVFLYDMQSSAHVPWHPTQAPVTNLPVDPTDPFYEKFQKVPSIEVTADNFITNFLFINPTNTRVKRQAPGTLIDNVIVMDGSGSVGNCEFQRGKAAIKNMMKSANAVAVENKYDEKYAAVTFATSASVNFKFLPYSTAEQRLTMVQFPGGATNTQAGLAEAMKLFVESLTGGRFADRKNVLLITDGRSNVDTHLTKPNADKLKALGVHIYVFAVGSYIDGIGEMVQLAGSKYSTKPDDFLFRIKGYHQLWEFTKLVVTKLASTGKYISLSPAPSPC
ncbi:collagen alpha-1(VI) chain-like [Porites lutea]|uniref:collagen alpha-1(VI) chain-like n=1 Tax=Porites lutea TaxID=51062 RepID=UPI003CC588A1